MTLSFVLSVTFLAVFLALTVGTIVRMHIMKVPWPLLGFSPVLCLSILVFLPLITTITLLVRPSIFTIPSNKILAEFSFFKRVWISIGVWLWVIRNYPVVVDMVVVITRKFIGLSKTKDIVPEVAQVILRESFV